MAQDVDERNGAQERSGPSKRIHSPRGVDELTPLNRDGSLALKSDASFGCIDHMSSWLGFAGRVPASLVASIFLTQHLLKGLVAGGGDEGLIGKPVEFLLGAHHVTAGRLQAMVAVGAQSPWVLKPLIGLLSDTVPIFGYKRNSYLMILTVLSCCSVLCLATGLAYAPHAIIVCLFFASLQVAGATLLVDAKQSELTKDDPTLGPELVSFRETCMNVGMLLSAMATGQLISAFGPRAPYYLAFPAVASLFVVACNNWLGDARLAGGADRTSLERVKQNFPLFCLGMMLLPLIIVLGVGSALQLSHNALGTMAACVTLTIVIGYGALIRFEISGPVIFFFILRCLTPQLSGAFFYFFTDSPAAYPGGPHFSASFYVSCITAVAVLGRAIGVLTAKKLFGSWHYSSALWVTIPGVALTQSLLVPLLLRWNLALGIPDHAWVLAWTFVDMVVRGWRQFPLAVAMLQATPRGLEASSIALNTGAVNMGITLSSFFGGFVLHMFEVVPSGVPADSMSFAGLWKAQLVAALSPTLALFLMPALMPSRGQDETLITDNPGSATHGAPLERLLGRAARGRVGGQAV